MPSRSALDEYSEAVDEIVHLADRELDQLLTAHRRGRLLKGELLEEMKRLTSVFGDVATHAALEYYEAERGEAYPDGDLPRVIPKSYSGTYVEKTILPLLDEQWDDHTKLSQTMRSELARFIRNQGRRTIRENMGADSKRPTWARVPRGAKTCAFCYMLASRGFAYESDESAGLHDKFHKGCDCRIVPSFDKKGRESKLDGYEPDRMRAVYLAARKSGDTPGDTLERMRHMHPGKFSDGVGEGGRSDGKGRGKREGAKDKYPRTLQPGKVRTGQGGKDGTVGLKNYDEWRNSIIERYNALAPEERARRKVPPRDPVALPGKWDKDLPMLDVKTFVHIVHSDSENGGHLSGFGWIHTDLGRVKTEFPSEWSEFKVFNALSAVLSEKWEAGSAEPIYTEYDGVPVCVRLAKRKTGIRVSSFYVVSRYN